MERCASIRSIPGGIQAAHPIFTSRGLSTTTGQLYFPDPVTEHVYATTSPYRERKAERDTSNGDDFIFVEQGGNKTIVNLKENGGSYLARLVVGIRRNA